MEKQNAYEGEGLHVACEPKIGSNRGWFWEG
jgi:hypothetical protein